MYIYLLVFSKRKKERNTGRIKQRLRKISVYEAGEVSVEEG